MKDLVTRLKANDSEAFTYVYNEAYKMCARMIMQQGGDTTACQDVFQEAIMILLNKIRQPGFVLSSKISTFMYGICRNVWMQKQQNESKVDLNDDFSFLESTVTVDNSLVERNDSLLRHAVQVLENFAKEDCADIIKWFYFDNYSLKEIAARMDYTEAYAKKKKFNCMQYLKKQIQTTFKMN